MAQEWNCKLWSIHIIILFDYNEIKETKMALFVHWLIYLSIVIVTIK